MKINSNILFFSEFKQMFLNKLIINLNKMKREKFLNYNYGNYELFESSPRPLMKCFPTNINNKIKK